MTNNMTYGTRKANAFLKAVAKATQGDASYCVLAWNARWKPTGAFTFHGSIEDAKAYALKYCRCLDGNNASVTKAGEPGVPVLLFVVGNFKGRIVETLTQTELEAEERKER
jgi:hypothetical protein